MMTGNDDAARAREDSFLGELVPQVTEHLAAQHAGGFDAEAGRARFMTWLATHTKEPAADAGNTDVMDLLAAQRKAQDLSEAWRRVARIPGASEGKEEARKDRKRSRPAPKPQLVLGGFLNAHPVVTAAAIATGALAALNRAKWIRGTARVRDLVSLPDYWVLVEMDDDAVFVADPEYLQSLHSAQQAGIPVRYWINNFQMVHNRPRGGIGDIRRYPS